MTEFEDDVPQLVEQALGDALQAHVKKLFEVLCASGSAEKEDALKRFEAGMVRAAEFHARCVAISEDRLIP